MAIFKFRNLNTGQAMPIPPGEYTVGRDDDTHVHVEDGTVSRRHAKVYNLDDGFFVEDNGSANGTAKDGAFITDRTKIEYGDVVYIGSVPFRVDPEILPGAEMEHEPEPGLRPANRDYIKKNTERLPLPGEAPRFIETISPEKLAAPEVNANDADAEDLNAITMTEPAAEPMRLPTVRTGLTPLPKESVPAQPTLFTTSPQQQAKAASVITVEPPRPATLAPTTIPRKKVVPPTATPESSTANSLPVATSSSTGSKSSWLVIFLAGLGVGLLLGLVFAKIFFEMGGKVASLP